MKINKLLGTAFILFGVGLAAWAGFVGWQQQMLAQSIISQTRLTPSPTTTPGSTHLDTPTPSWQAEPIVPTAPPIKSSTLNQAESPGPTPSALPVTNLPVPTSVQQSDAPPTPPASPTDSPADSQTLPSLPTLSLPPASEIKPSSASITKSEALKRFGVGAPYLHPLKTEAVKELGLGWYLAWGVLETPPGPAGVEFWQMIRLSEQGFHPEKETLQRIAQTTPGMTWLIGNEPDVRWQDNVTPARYAELYHDLYYFLKAADPSAQVVIGGITQPTPLRLQYLEMVLSAYQARYSEEMPVDVWNIHNFMLREERDSWGVDIPPGLGVDQGVLFEIDDHDDLEVFKAQIIGFRQWMADRGQRNKPLIISEYGILMPEDYGFPLERVKDFMYGTYNFMLNATDEQIGYPADDNRLVQRWAWYSLSDDRYATGNLINLETGELTDLGHVHREYIANLP